MVKKNYFLIFFFVFLSTFSLLKIFNNVVNLDTYEYGEWLINYQSGFIRRGLSGEIIFQLSRLFNNNLQLTYFTILSIICLIFYRLNYILLKKFFKYFFWNIFDKKHYYSPKGVYVYNFFFCFDCLGYNSCSFFW